MNRKVRKAIDALIGNPPYFSDARIRRKEQALEALWEWLEKLDAKEDQRLFLIIQDKIKSLVDYLKHSIPLSNPEL